MACVCFHLLLALFNLNIVHAVAPLLSMGSTEPINFERRVLEPINFWESANRNS